MADSGLILAVTRAQAGDPRAFDYLVQRFQNAAVAYARSLLRDPAAAEDAAQEAFVQAWRDLPRLNQPMAFGAWLRRLVFKFCDRIRRSARPSLPLEESLPLPRDQEPALIAERAESAAQVHAALDTLPAALREATFLYYLTGYDVREIAAFLEVPPSTVKNRLHAARKKLRKELWTMAENTLVQEKPSQDATFVDNVVARILAEFEQQEAADRHSVDRGLLDQGRAALVERLAQDAPLDSQTAHDGFLLLWRKQDWTTLSSLLMRYLAEPLSNSETAWAYLHLANTINSVAGVVLAHETFERWMPGKTPRLSFRWPYFPVPEDSADPAFAGEEVGLLFLHQSTAIGDAYRGIWRQKDYLHKVDTALAQIPITPRNRSKRFYALRMAGYTCEVAGDWDGSQRYIQQMHALAAGAEDETLQTDIECRTLGHEMNLARLRQDETAFAANAAKTISLLDAAEQKGDGRATWVRAARHDLAHHLIKGSRHEQALPLLEANAATGGHLGDGWGWLLHAAALWQQTGDRERTLALLREARAHDDRELAEMFLERPEFADVHADPEFLEAVRRG